MSTRIGITERGDAGLDFSWRQKIWTLTDGRAILITKNLSKAFCEAVLEETAKGARLIVHATITGCGGTLIEPNVPPMAKTLKNLRVMLNRGFPANQLVLRIDPIIPGFENYAQSVINRAIELQIIPTIDVKVSVMDAYPHVRRRFEQAGIPLEWRGFAPSDDTFRRINEMLGYYAREYGIHFTTCAEGKLTNAEPRGCVGIKECEILGVDLPDNGVNPQGRNGCLCLCGVKTELLESKKRCPHQCLYCYWRD